MRALVTGAGGFVGRYLVAELRARKHEVVDAAFDVNDPSAVAVALDASEPDIVYHLAAQASTADATRGTLETYRTNVLGTATLVDALRTRAERPLLIFASSGEVYGAQAPDAFPLKESALPQPATTYAASKLAAEGVVLGATRSHGLRAIVVRSFNLIGPGQSERFVVGAFARRLARIAVGGPKLFPVGNLTPQRDFSDVRDGVKAYADLAERGEPGEIYNLSSGVPTAIATLLRELVYAAGVALEIREDPALVRAADVPLLYGDNGKLRSTTGWSPEIPLKRTLRETYAAALEVETTYDGKESGGVG